MSNLSAKNGNKSRINIPQTGEMSCPTEQKERKTIQEEGELAAAFNLVDKEGNLNFTLLTCKITYLSCHTLYEN